MPDDHISQQELSQLAFSERVDIDDDSSDGIEIEPTLPIDVHLHDKIPLDD